MPSQDDLNRMPPELLAKLNARPEDECIACQGRGVWRTFAGPLTLYKEVLCERCHGTCKEPKQPPENDGQGASDD